MLRPNTGFALKLTVFYFIGIGNIANTDRLKIQFDANDLVALKYRLS